MLISNMTNWFFGYACKNQHIFYKKTSDSQLPEKYKENFNVSSEASLSKSRSNDKKIVRLVQATDKQMLH